MRTRDRMSCARAYMWLFSMVSLILCYGCLPYTRSPGVRLLNKGEYAAAADRLREECTEHPADAGLRRNLGIAHFHMGEPSRAIDLLREARSLDPRDAQAALYLGRACEDAIRDSARPMSAAALIDSALTAYIDYLAIIGRDKAEVRGRIQVLSREKARGEAESVLARERSLAVEGVLENAIAVPDFVNVMGADSLGPLTRGLSFLVMTDLSKVEQLRLLERASLQVLLDELRRGEGATVRTRLERMQEWHSLRTPRGVKERLALLIRPETGQPYLQGPIDAMDDLTYFDAVCAFQADHELAADGIVGARTRAALQAETIEVAESETVEPAIVAPESAPRIGKLLGARRLVHGRFVAEVEPGVQLAADLSDVLVGGTVPAGAPVHGPLSEILQLEKELVYQILATLGIEPTPEEREEIDELPTRSLLAFLAFSRGLELEDAGWPHAAAEAYRQALDIDPGFRWAADREAVSRAATEGLDKLGRAELIRGNKPPKNRRERLDLTGTQSGMGPGPDEDRTAEQNPADTEAQKIQTEAGITITGDLPGRNRP